MPGKGVANDEPSGGRATVLWAWSLPSHSHLSKPKSSSIAMATRLFDRGGFKPKAIQGPLRLI